MTRQVLVFEWLNGGGLWQDQAEPSSVRLLVRQGREMLEAVCSDFQRCGWKTLVPIDARFQLNPEFHHARFVDSYCTVEHATDLRTTLVAAVAAADAFLIIAPETADRLLHCQDWLRDYEHKSLNADVPFVSLASNKNRLQQYLGERGIPIPLGVPAGELIASNPSADSSLATHGNLVKLLDPDFADDRRPASRKSAASASFFEIHAERDCQWVLKPADGCGGEGIRIFETLMSLGGVIKREKLADAWRVEELIDGVAASVSVIANGKDAIFLPALRQTFGAEPFGQFACCVNDLDWAQQTRARRLAEATFAALSPVRGFFGIDCVLGTAVGESIDKPPCFPNNDFVIEVNPRLTMSYPVLQTMLNINLAEQIIFAGNPQASKIMG